MRQKTLLVLNGPNLNLLGTREPEIYGAATLQDIEKNTKARAALFGFEISFFQSNHEGQLIDQLHDARDTAAGIILNAGALTHTSVALFDALKAIGLPCVEVHISNIFKREVFRHHSYISPAALGMITGLGPLGYELAVEALCAHLLSDIPLPR